MRFTQKYAIVQLLEPMPEDTVYDRKDWPLHVTLADVFATKWSESMLLRELAKFAKDQQPIVTSAADDTFFGPENSVRVVLLERNEALINLHSTIVSLLEKGGVIFNTPEFTKEGFVAHSTVQSHKRLHKGDEVCFNSLSLIDLFPSENPYRRKLIRTVPFAR